MQNFGKYVGSLSLEYPEIERGERKTEREKVKRGAETKKNEKGREKESEKEKRR